MIALALDTSGPVGSVAVVGGEGSGPGARVLAQRSLGEGMRRGVELFPSIEAALREAGVSAREIDVVAVGTGPGSYTGLRVGVTAARALAYAAGAELIGIPSCDALAEATPRGEEMPSESLAVVIDSRVRAIYVALYRATDAATGGAPWRRAGGPEILAPNEAAERIPPGALVVGDAIEAHAELFAPFRRAAEPRNAGAPEIARLALAARERGERQSIDTVVPLYLRKTEAERKLDGAQR